jgi:hypothetical protein
MTAPSCKSPAQTQDQRIPSPEELQKLINEVFGASDGNVSSPTRQINIQPVSKSA